MDRLTVIFPFGEMKMSPDALEVARSQYTAAYEAYQQATKRVAEILESGLIPSGNELSDEAKAAEQLAVARRALLDAMASIAPQRR